MKHRCRVFCALASLMVAAQVSLACASDDAEAPSAVVEGDAGTDGAPVTFDAAADAAASDGASATPAKCSQDGWCYTDLPAEGSYDAGAHSVSIGGFAFSMRSVWVAPDHHAWAVTDLGHVLEWDGTAWSVRSTATQALLSVWGASATDLWVAGDRGLVLHGAVGPNGISFVPVGIDTTETITHVWGRSASDVWALADRVYHLESNGTDPPSFVAVDVPHAFEDPDVQLEYSSIWGDENGVWIGGSETTYCDPVNCEFQKQLFVTKKKNMPDRGGEWDYVGLPLDEVTNVPAGVTTSDGLQVAAVRPYGDEGMAIRVATDPSLLGPTSLPDGGTGEVTITADGTYAWTQEQVESFGAPEGMWATSSKDVWMVGISGVVRHYDGTNWQIGRLALTPQLPLLYNLHSIHGIVSSTGEQDLWIVGDDVALHRTVKP